MDIIILGLVACFIFYKLSKILGKIDDEERNNIEEKIRKQKEASEQFLNSLNYIEPLGEEDWGDDF